MPDLLCDHHRAALSHAEHTPGMTERFRRFPVALRIDQLAGLLERGCLGLHDLGRHILDGITRIKITGEENLVTVIGLGCCRGRNSQAERVIARQIQLAAKSGDRRVADTAGLGQIGNGQVLYFLLVRQDVICDFLF